MCSFFEASITPINKTLRSFIFSHFHSSLRAFLFAINTAVDLSITSTIFKLLALIVEPVCVLSIITSTSSGGFASVAPKDKNILILSFSPHVFQGVMTTGVWSP